MDAPKQIDLAQETPLSLGGLEVRPATLEVIAGDRRQQLEPRIMQVLVALARRRGEVVSRDELIASCWRGLTVGDDSISRCIFRLRKLAEAVGGFSIDTVPRVGFRLNAIASSAAPAPPLDVSEVLLAVLPFDDLSDEADLVYFSDGVSEEILHAVARRTDLRVIGRSSSFCFRGADKSARKVAQELGATHILDGSVRRSGDLVRVSVELVECAGQTSIWSDRFDRHLTDILALQDAVAAAVAAALRTRFVHPDTVRKIDPVAYDLFLQAHPSPGAGHIPTSRAIALLERVVSLAPDFGEAWGDLAHYRAQMYRGTTLDPVQVTVRRSDVVTAAERALLLAPDNASAQVALGNLLPYGDHAGREAAFRHAFLANKASTESRLDLAWFLSGLGRNLDALELAAEGLEVDPLDAKPGNLYGQMLCAVGRYEDSHRAFSEFRGRWPQLSGFISAPMIMAACVGDRAEFRRLRSLLEEFPNPPPFAQDALQRCETLLEPTTLRRTAILEELRGQVAQNDTPDLGLLLLAHQVGLVEETFGIVDSASFVQVHAEDGPSPTRNRSPGILFDRMTNRSMLEDPRFVMLCGKLGLCGYWRGSGNWPDCADYVSYDFKSACAVAVADISRFE